MSLSAAIGDLAPGVDAAIPTEAVYRLSVDQYHQMAAAGILEEGAPLELLDGFLVPKMKKTPAHRVVTHLARETLEGILPAGWYVSSQDPITLSTSEPEPDAAVIRGGFRDYPDRHPEAHEVALVVEVADASLRRDRSTKKGIYASAGIPFYWIVNLVDKRVEVFSEPTTEGDAPDYRQHRDFVAGDTIAVVLEGRGVGEIQAQAILP